MGYYIVMITSFICVIVSAGILINIFFLKTKKIYLKDDGVYLGSKHVMTIADLIKIENEQDFKIETEFLKYLKKYKNIEYEIIQESDIYSEDFIRKYIKDNI